jgi:acetoin utilization protein AcuB
MTINPKTVTPDQTISEVLDLMHEFKIHRIPVVDKGKLVGLVTQGVVQENTPSHLTTLSIHEMNYLLSKTRVKDIMIKKVITVGPEALVEGAADIMEKKDIGCLPVVSESNELLGILTTSDILKAFVDMFGYHQVGTRVTVLIDDRVGEFAAFTKLFADNNISISHFANHGNEVVIRCNELNKKRVSDLLEKNGYTITSIL